MCLERDSRLLVTCTVGSETNGVRRVASEAPCSCHRGPNATFAVQDLIALALRIERSVFPQLGQSLSLRYVT